MSRFASVAGTLAITLLLCSACSAPPSPSGGYTTTSLPEHPGQAILFSTPTLVEPRQSSPDIASPCPAAATPEPQPSDPRPLRVIYADEGRLWLWREEMGDAIPYVLSGEWTAPLLSPDGRLIAFERQAGDGGSELWVVGTDGIGERRLAAPDPRETLERYHEASGVSLLKGWLPNSLYLWYRLVPNLAGTGEEAYESLWLVDAEGGVPRQVLPAGEAWNVAFAPDGQQLAALTARELRLLDVSDGRVTHTVPFEAHSTYRQELSYSSDGRYVLVYVSDGVAVVDSVSRQRRDIPLAYVPFGASHHAYYPAMHWLGGGTSALSVVYDVGSWLERLEPTAAFSVWRLDLAQGTAGRLGTFTGGAWGVSLSPDGRRVAYVNHDCTTLSLADLQTGDSVVYDQQQVLVLFGWHHDSVHFVYRGRGAPLLGSVCGPPVHLQSDDGSWLCASFHPIPGRDDFVILSDAPGGGAHLIQLYTLDGRSKTVAMSVARGRPTTLVGYFVGD